MSGLAELGLRFVERCQAKTATVSVEDFLATIKEMGFDCAACGAWLGVGKNRRHRFFFVTWPQDWLELYDKNGWVEIDPLPIQARRRIAPFLWSEIKDAKITAVQRAFYQTFCHHGWRDCFAVPIHGPGSLQGLVTMATRQSRGR